MSTTTYAQNDSSFFSRRATALILIACLHGVLIYAFATGLGPKAFAVLPPVIQANFLPQEHRKDPPPPPTQPDLTHPRVQLIPPVIKLDFPPEQGVIKDVTTEPPPVIRDELPPPPPRAVNRVLGGPGKGFPNTDDYYPPASIRLGEAGTTTVRVCVDTAGRLGAEPTVAQTSGIARLDDAALKLAKAGSGRYRATLEDGRAVGSCYPFRITFRIRN